MILEPSFSLISIYPLPHAVCLRQTQSYVTEASSFNRGYVGKLHLHTLPLCRKRMEICLTVFALRDLERCSFSSLYIALQA